MQEISTDIFTSQLASGKINAASDNALNGKTRETIRQSAEEFEAIFISQMLGPMMESAQTEGIFGGGNAEKMYQSMFVDEVGKSIARSGGLGIADQVFSELIKLQEG